MRLMLRAYLRLTVFALGLLAGVQLPGFVDQYAKRVDAHFIEASRNFAGFQRTADQYFGGSVEALLVHHRSSTDPVFRDEAKTIATLYARLQMLAAELKALSGGLLARIAHVALKPNRELLDETLSAYSYTVPLNGAAIICGISIGLSFALLVESLVLAAAALIGRLAARALRPRPVAQAPRPPHRSH